MSSSFGGHGSSATFRGDKRTAESPDKLNTLHGSEPPEARVCPVAVSTIRNDKPDYRTSPAPSKAGTAAPGGRVFPGC